MTETPAETAGPLRICDVCGGVDAFPRHMLAAPQGAIPVNQANLVKLMDDQTLSSVDRARIVADIIDTTTQLRHHDCCRKVGCPDGTCNLIPASITDHAEIQDHILSGALTAAHEVVQSQEA